MQRILANIQPCARLLLLVGPGSWQRGKLQREGDRSPECDTPRVTLAESKPVAAVLDDINKDRDHLPMTRGGYSCWLPPSGEFKKPVHELLPTVVSQDWMLKIRDREYPSLANDSTVKMRKFTV